jgi:hypothetical protein
MTVPADDTPEGKFTVDAPDDSGDARVSEAVRRLARPHRSGGDVVEHAAVLAEGANSGAILAWIAAHDGVPEAAAPRSGHRGLHGAPRGGESSKPARYILPSGAVPPAQ